MFYIFEYNLFFDSLWDHNKTMRGYGNLYVHNVGQGIGKGLMWGGRVSIWSKEMETHWRGQGVEV